MMKFYFLEKSWYFALCLVMHLETGYIVQPMEKCKKFIRTEVVGYYVSMESTGEMRLLVCKWLWEIRNENWEAARIFEDLIESFSLRDDGGEDLHNQFSALHLLEGLVIYMVNKMDTKNPKEAEKTDKFFCSLFKKVKKASVVNEILKPRLYHLKAYYTMVKYDNYKAALKYLRKGYRIAEKQHNELEMSWITHSELAWANKLSTDEMYAWLEHAHEGNCMHYTDSETLDYTFMHYSLPLPLYI